MLTLADILMAIAPFVIVLGLLAWTGRRERRRREVHTRQVALIDRIHKRLGAVASPVVRRHRRGWRVSMAVPFERPAMSEALLRIVLDALPSPRSRSTAARNRPEPAARHSAFTGGRHRCQTGVDVMDVNTYLLEILVRDRLAEMRARGEQASRVKAARQHGHPLRSIGSAVDSSRAMEAERSSKHGAVRS